MINKISEFEKKIKVKLNNKSLLVKALTHKSANMNSNNEKLEFLGDRVIGIILSEELYNLYPNVNEGELDKRFAVLVNRKTCCSVAWSMQIQNYIITGDKKKIININDEKILSDCCEAIIGDIYIDRGFDYVKKFVLKLWKKNIEKSNITIFDPKTKLQEHSLKKYKKLPLYKLVSFEGPKHRPLFKIAVSITGTKKVLGIGKSKQDAEQNGASNLLKKINVA